jgi:hypothetical protein
MKEMVKEAAVAFLFSNLYLDFNHAEMPHPM